jgi:hypothetical protein
LNYFWGSLQYTYIMNWSKIFIISIVTVILSSCQHFKFVCRSIYSNHYKISEKRLAYYLTKHNIDTANLLYCNDSFYIKIFSEKFQSDSSIGLNSFRPIQFRVFDSSGTIVNTWANCYGPLSNFIKDYNDLLVKKINPDIYLNTRLSDYYSMMKVVPTINANDYDMVILVFWEWFMGDYSLKMLKELEALPNAKNRKVLLLKLNLDNSK